MDGLTKFKVGIAELSKPRHRQVRDIVVRARSKRHARIMAKGKFPAPKFRVCRKIERSTA